MNGRKGSGPRSVGKLVLLLLVSSLRPLEGAELPLDIEVPILVVGDSDEDLDEDLETDLSLVVLSAAKRIETVQQNSSIVTVITRDEIVQRGYLGLPDLLDTVPGFEGHRPSFSLMSTDVFARGNPRTVLFLWNGVAINSPQNNRRGLGPYLPVDAIGRAEVVSGPGGVLWGADAFMGIVSL